MTRSDFRDRPVGAFARIGAGHAEIERVVFRHEGVGGDRGGDRDRQLLGERDRFRRGAGEARAAAEHDHRLLRRHDVLRRLLDALGIGRRAEGGDLRVGLLDEHLRHFEEMVLELAVIAGELEIDRTGIARGRLAEGLAQQVGQAGDLVDLEIRLGQLLEDRIVVIFLIGALVLLARLAAAGEADDRAVAHERIAQARRDIGGADRLAAADARPARGAGIAVGHIGGGLLAVAEHALDLHVVHLGQRAARAWSARRTRR